jgi:CubicO group peptidase (beta-lactamase class C family)
MRLILVSLALLALPAFPQSSHSSNSSSGLDAERLKLIRPRLQDLVESHVIPGAVALVARKGEVTLDATGWRDVEGRKPMEKDSIFQIMSMTKNFTGVAIMMLVEEGKVELRRPVADYLPEFRDQMVEERLPNGNTALHPPAQRPTVAQLMSHTSGLAGDPEGELSDNPRTLRVPLAEAVRFYGRQHLQFEPGTRWRYSNMGIAALGRIIEAVSGEEYVHYIETRLLTPLGMHDTFFFPPDAKKDRIACTNTPAASWCARGMRFWRAMRPGIAPARSTRRPSSDSTPRRRTCSTSTRCCSMAARTRAGAISRASRSTP